MKNTTKVIKAADFMPSAQDIERKKEKSKDHEPLYEEIMLSDEDDGLILRLFGDLPDYSDERFDNLWHKVMDSEPTVIYDYCLQKGIDVIDNSGSAVPSWRDIAVMLMAIDEGLLKKVNP